MINIAQEQTAAPIKKKKLTSASNTWSLVIVLILICAVFTVLSPYFLSLKNFLNIGTYAAIVGVMGAGVTVAMLLSNIDLSQYSVLTLASMVATILMQNGASLFVAIIAALAVGVVCGIINGTLIAWLKISGIITTMGTMQIFRGVAYLMTNGKTVMVLNKSYDVIGRGYLFKTIPVAILIMIFVFAVIFYVLKYTSFGRKVFAVGGNESSCYLSGIKVPMIKFYAMIISSVCASIAGLITSSQVGAAVASTGVGAEMGVLAAVILGGISLTGGRGKISGTVIGIFILAIIQNGMTLLSIASFYQMIINGSILIIAVFIDVLRRGVLSKK